MSTPAEFGRYLRTVAHLRPGQVVARGRLRAQRVGLRQAPRLAAVLLQARPSPGYWPTSHLPLDGQIALTEPSCPQLAQGQLTLLGHTRDLVRSGRRDARGQGARGWDWEQADAPLLWRYHLHYWDWAWTLIRDGAPGRATFARLYLGWREAIPLGHPVAWSPYVASLRAWTLCALHPILAAPPHPTADPSADLTAGLTAGLMAQTRATVRADLGTLHAYLRTHQETDVGGNHLLKNLKALIALEIAAGDRHGLRRRLTALVHQIDRQILADGGHFERAPAYHCQVLADLDDIAGLLAAVGRPVPRALTDAATRMRGWLSTVLGPDGTVPLLNDGYPVSAALLRRLLTPPFPHPEPQPCAPPSGPVPVTAPVATTNPPATRAEARAVLLAESGLAVLTAGDWHLLADVGLPCPDSLPAHAHADTLAFLLWLDAEPILVDPGTSTYTPGPRRDHERGTAAHSTITVDDTDSTEVWGAFRAGRRARPSAATLHRTPTAATVTAGHDGYRHLPGAPHHQRLWRLDQHGLVLRDRVSGTGQHRITLRLHFAPGITLAPDPPAEASAFPSRPVLVTPLGWNLLLHNDVPGQWRLHTTPRALSWERTVPALSAELTVDAALPLTLRTSLTALRPGTPDLGDRHRVSVLAQPVTHPAPLRR
ncbi:heparinase II/III family protein [Frankia sp. AgPm24]|uniref:heparinase II/III domain-containing protein n=1 Tax=Frankia sp. AgPm24 TaxID=631128 RepID=UPI00200BA21E|nr:heparinase II/III family protein [Frankia sp. AgPm24]MCK9921740.1 heparinase II/III family protein [Frankia sp. AgPm24]